MGHSRADRSIFQVITVLATVIGAQASASDGLTIARYGVVNDQVVDAVTPGGLVLTRSGDLITTFVDKGDSAAGSRCYFVRSTDLGRTWSAPFLTLKPRNEYEGLFTEIVSLPDGKLMMLIMRIRHEDKSRKGVFRYRESTTELKVSRDDGHSFQSIGYFKTPPKSLTSTMGASYVLKSGDVIIPAYCYSPTEMTGHSYGAGFFRSRDGGKTWGPFEVVFKDPPSADETKQSFNETAFVVRDDGVVIAYARVDVHQGADYKKNNMWRCQSSDNGRTWSHPVETGITGICPMISRLATGEFVMLCGLRDSKVCRRTTSLFTSRDGIEWKYRGHPYYSRTKGRPYNSATGGGQAFVPIGERTIYVVFYACDPELPGVDKTYIDGGAVTLE